MGGWGGGVTPKFRSFDKAEPNSQLRGKYIRNDLIRIRISLISKWSGTPDKGLTPPIPFLSALCHQLNLLNPPHEKIPGYASAMHRVGYYLYMLTVPL
jgi:hypothetical protein